MTITKVYTREEINKLYHSLGSGTKCKTPPYAIFQIKMSDCTITAYESLKVVFQGNGAEFYSDIIKGKVATKKTSSSSKTTTVSVSEVFPQAGSDEVGTGDYFGPVVVCAAYVEEKDRELLIKLGIKDSKQIKDPEILMIAPQLIDHLKYSILILDNYKYNQVHETNNMNQIKAKLHNQAFINLQKKFNLNLSTIYVDQFTPPPSYFRYLKNESEVVRNIHFETKAEDKFLSVACASIIARYYFLDTLKKMDEKYDFTFPKGAGAHVDIIAKQLVEQHGKEVLWQVSKYHFANTDRIINEDD